jgi:monoamine oxidase
MKNTNIAILGAGLCGLTLAYFLKEKGYNVTILEARNRTGGRILTHKTAANTHIDLGPAWLWNQNTSLLGLLESLDLHFYEQYTSGLAFYEASATEAPQAFNLPINQEVSYRIVGGTQAIIAKLASSFTASELLLNQPVLKLQEFDNSIRITTPDHTYHADLVVSTIPPQVLVQTVTIEPALPESVAAVARETHTWMSASIKFGLSYERPFWKECGLSGTCYSNVGPFAELYDHSDASNSHYALAGFMNSAMERFTPEQRKEKISAQLARFLGDEALKFKAYTEQCWSQEPYTHVPKTHYITAHKNNGHPIYKESFMHTKLLIAGTETAGQYAGYMEGAVHRAQEIYNIINTANP